MDTVVNRLSEIETVARATMEEANACKKVFAEGMDAKTAAFDKGAEQETARKVTEIRGRMEADTNGFLAEQRTEPEALLEELEDNYNQCHEEYAEALFQKMIKG